ncbi:MAG TPA: TolC family protein [Burkholderiaceae bacterium]|jgi:NodT family efflux transporter outer membrane factor (OMF) lipoprotein|nr:TolC family protein [Burkholderiaceae bacterium]
MKGLSVILIACAVELAGCSTQPARPDRSRLSMPASWSAEAGGAIGNPDSWWKNFQDPQLDDLVDRALHTNNDFAVAAIRVHRARLQSALVGTNWAPAVAVDGFSTATRGFDPKFTARSSGLTSLLSFEVDLWGKLENQRQASRWEADASVADCRAFAAWLVGTTAKLYWQLAELNQLLAMADADIHYARRTLELARAKYEVGSISKLNAAEAELSLSTQEAARTELVQQRAEARNALAILFDQPPQSTTSERPALAEGAMPPIGAGLPAEILANRPDLQAAELRVREALVNVDVVRTSFYPTLTLTGTLGTSSDSLVKFLQNPVGTLGGDLALPFVQWKTAQLTTRIARTQYEEAAVGFRQRLYTALAEVENALSARAQLQAEERTLRSAIEQARLAESIARTRFEAGASDVQLWLDAQARVRGVERSLVLNRLNQFDNQADLYRALGLGVASDRPACGA